MLGRACLAALAVFVGFGGLAPSAAQDVGTIFRLMDQAIQHEQRKQIQRQQYEAERRRRQAEANRERRERQAEIDRERERQIAFIKRTQSALARLGFYTKKIDGDFGPSSRRALDDYASAFAESTAVFEVGELQKLEARAAAGWRSLDEERFAQNGGFRDRSELIAAREGGFTTAATFQAARNAGFDSAEQFAAFKASGFADPTQFERARKGGFSEPSEYQAAFRAGFTDRAEFRAFVASGIATKEEYERKKVHLERVASAMSDCIAAGSGGDWARALTACSVAAAKQPSDATATQLLQRAETEALRQVSELRVRKGEAERQLAVVLGRSADVSTGTTGKDEISALRKTIADADAAIFIVAFATAEGRCLAAAQSRAWAAAKTNCSDAEALLESQPSKTQRHENSLLLLRDLLAEASGEVQRAAEKAAKDAERAAKQAERLALEQVRLRASAALDEIELFLTGGGKFDQAIAVARAVSALRSAQPGDTAAGLQLPLTTLSGLLESDAGFVAARTARTEAVERARIEAATAAVAALERTNAFLTDFIAGNVTFAKMDDLLALQASVEAAVKEGGADRVLAMRSEATAALARLELADELAAFQFVPDPEQERELLRQQEADEASLTSARAEAARVIEEVASFGTSGRKLSKPIEAASAIARVRTAASANALPELQTALADLGEVLASDEGFATYARQRSQRADIQKANATTVARATAEVQLAFLQARISEDITSPDIEALVNAFKQLESALGGPDLGAVPRAKAEADAVIEQLGLSDALTAFAAARDANAGPELPKAPNGIVLTIANTALLAGADTDLLILRNDTAKAPHVIRNLVGELVFEGGEATACWYHQVPEPTYAFRLAQHRLSEMGVRELTVDGVCKPATLSQFDLIFLERGSFLAGDVVKAATLVDAFEVGEFKILDSVSESDVADRIAVFRETSEGIRSSILDGTRTGWGFVRVGESATGIVCTAATGEAVAHERFIAKQLDDLAFLLSAPPELVSTPSIERAFVDAKRGRCDAIYADAAMLATVIASLDAEKAPSSVLPVWLDQQAYSAALSEIEEARRSDRQISEQEQALAQEKEKARAAELSAIQAKLQSENRERALGAFKPIRDALHDFTLGKAGEPAAAMFPGFAAALTAAKGDHWKVNTFTAELVDFGVAKWDSRSVEAVIARITVSLENPILGQYREECAIAGYLNDTEFNRYRDPFEASCETSEAAVESWRTGAKFKSLWMPEMQ